MQFDWDEGNFSHIRAHGVSQAEAEQALIDPLGGFLEVAVVEGEERSRHIGATIQGRLLIVLTTMRGESIRVVTAFDAGGRAAREYREGRTDER